MNISPIKNQRDYRKVLKAIEGLMSAKRNTPEGDRLDVLVTLVEAWERKHYPMDLPDPVEAIKYHMDQNGLQPRDLIPFIGSRNRVHEVLNRGCSSIGCYSSLLALLTATLVPRCGCLISRLLLAFLRVEALVPCRSGSTVRRSIAAALPPIALAHRFADGNTPSALISVDGDCTMMAIRLITLRPHRRPRRAGPAWQRMRPRPFWHRSSRAGF